MILNLLALFSGYLGCGMVKW